MNLPTTDDIYEELRAVLRHYDAAHRNAEVARIAHSTIETQIAEIKRAYLNDIYADPQAKLKWSNQERKEEEAQTRLENHWPDLVEREAQAGTHRRATAAELERSAEALKAYRVLTALVETERRMDAAQLELSSLPRMVRR